MQLTNDQWHGKLEEIREAEHLVGFANDPSVIRPHLEALRVAMITECRDCHEDVDQTEAHAVEDKTGAVLCLECADHYWSVTIRDVNRMGRGIVNTGCSTHQQSRPVEPIRGV